MQAVMQAPPRSELRRHTNDHLLQEQRSGKEVAPGASSKRPSQTFSLPTPHGGAGITVSAAHVQIIPLQVPRKPQLQQPQQAPPPQQGHSPRGARQQASATQAPTVSKGAISQLQEFVQGAKLFPMPPNCPVLQWDHDTRMTGASLEFRATVAFLLDGVPHHTVGSWKSSKKLAQRDAAERTLGLFVNRWGELMLQQQEMMEQSSTPSKPHTAGADQQQGLTPEHCAVSEMQCLEDFLVKCPYSQAMPQWSHRWENDLCQAFAEVRLLSVSHTFSGKSCDCLEAAYADVARRVLWYLHAPGWEDAFEPDVEYVRTAAQEIPEPAPGWVKDGDSEGEDQQLAERKTVIMRVQNRIQQAYARQLEPGTSVWYWSYERDIKDKGWPPLFRATVHLPLAGRTFVGAWLRGQREAQIDACSQITEFLDEEFPRSRNS